MGQHEKVNTKLEKKFYRLPAKNPGPINQVVRTVQLPAIISSETTNQTLEICVNHVDDVPRFLNLYLVKKGKAQLIGKEYLSENDSEGCFQFHLTPKQLRSDLEININDAYGNQSALQPLNIK